MNLVERHIEVYAAPKDDTYGTTERYDRSQSLRPKHFPALEVRVAEVLK